MLPYEPGSFCPAHYSSVADRMAEACGLMTISGMLVGVSGWGMNGDQPGGVREGCVKLEAMGAQRRELLAQFRGVQEGSQEGVTLEGHLEE